MLRSLLQNVALKNDILTTIYNGFTHLHIEENSKIIINYYNKNSSTNSIILQMEDIRKLSQYLNIYKCDRMCKFPYS